MAHHMVGFNAQIKAIQQENTMILMAHNIISLIG